MPSGVTPESLRSGAPGFGRAQLLCLSFPCPVLALGQSHSTRDCGWCVPHPRWVMPEPPARPQSPNWTEKVHRGTEHTVLGWFYGDPSIGPNGPCGSVPARVLSDKAPGALGSSQARCTLPRGEKPQKPGAQLPPLHSWGTHLIPPPNFWQEPGPTKHRWHTAVMRSGAKSSEVRLRTHFGKILLFPLKTPTSDRAPAGEADPTQLWGAAEPGGGGGTGLIWGFTEAPRPQLAARTSPPARDTLSPWKSSPPLRGATQAHSSRWPRPG